MVLADALGEFSDLLRVGSAALTHLSQLGCNAEVRGELVTYTQEIDVFVRRIDDICRRLKRVASKSSN